jgi:dihydroxyacetone kinase
VNIRKLINDPFEVVDEALEVVDEALEGFVAVHADLVTLAAPRVVARTVRSGVAKVGLVIGGGSGHEPAFLGYVGEGIADAACCGNVFASPPSDVVLAAIHAANYERGVILSYGNYAGDVMNFSLAAELAGAEGIDVREVRVTDDVASAPPDEAHKRRVIAGLVPVFKCLGAAAERGDSMDDVARIGAKANRATRSMGVALSACEVPGAGRPTFELPDARSRSGWGSTENRGSAGDPWSRPTRSQPPSSARSWPTCRRPSPVMSPCW